MKKSLTFMIGLTLAVLMGSAPVAHASPGPVTTIVVLGAKPGTRILDNRLDKAAELSNTYPLTPIVVTGWGGSRISESAYMRAGLLARGVNPVRIIEEPNAGNTKENAEQTAPILRTTFSGTAIIVTQRFHMKRALANFRNADPTITYTPAYARD